MKVLKSLFKSMSLFKYKYCAPLVYDDQDFQVKGKTVVLENDLKINLPEPLIGKHIKQVKLIPKYKQVEVVFTYEQNETFFSQLKLKNKFLSIDLSLNELARATTNSVMWLLLMNKAVTPRLFV